MRVSRASRHCRASVQARERAPSAAALTWEGPMEPPAVYVVDDDPSVRAALRRLLRSGGHPVRLFASAEQFLANTDSSARGCLILDVMMPGMSGLQLHERLASHGWELPVIFITS